MSNNDTPVPLCDDPEIEKNEVPEAELVEDDDAAEYEESHAGIKISYSLKENEIYSCLKHLDFFKKRFRKSCVYLALFAVIFVFFGISFFVKQNVSLLVCSIVALIFGLISFVAPFIDIKVMSKKNLLTGKYDVEIYPDEIEVTNDNLSYVIPLDGTCRSEEIDGMLVIFMPQDQIFIIPDRCLDPDFASDVQAMIISGTSLEEEE